MTSKPPKSEWARFDRTLSIIAQQSHGGTRDPKIREALEAALADGIVQSRLNRDEGYPPTWGDFSKGEDLPQGFWAPGNSARASLGGDVFGCVAIHLDGLMEWLDGPQPTSKGAKRGRKFKWDWDAFWIKATLHAAQHGLPDIQAKFVGIMRRWFIEMYGDAPADSEIRKRTSALYNQRDADN